MLLLYSVLLQSSKLLLHEEKIPQSRTLLVFDAASQTSLRPLATADRCQVAAQY